MIVDNTYFKDEIYIPYAKPSVTSDVTSVESDLNNFINKYERECLIRCFGYTLYAELFSKLDATKPTLIKDGEDAKWDELVNGKIYTINDKTYQWRGLRFKNFESDTSPTRSLIANFIYWFYEKDYDIIRAGVGNVAVKGKNSERVSNAPKVVRAWSEMVKMIIGENNELQPVITEKSYGIGIDYYNNNNEVCLYKFIKDANELVADTYADFTPSYWDNNINEYGI